MTDENINCSLQTIWEKVLRQDRPVPEARERSFTESSGRYMRDFFSYMRVRTVLHESQDSLSSCSGRRERSLVSRVPFIIIFHSYHIRRGIVMLIRVDDDDDGQTDIFSLSMHLLLSQETDVFVMLLILVSRVLVFRFLFSRWSFILAIYVFIMICCFFSINRWPYKPAIL